MAARVVFLSLDQVLAIHAKMRAVAGGEDGIIKQDGLESAIAAPQATYGGEHLNAFPFKMAAAYLVGFAMNHAFVDGNKRVAAVAAAVFLELNGWRLTLAPKALSDLVLGVARGEFTKPAVAGVLASGSVRLGGRRALVKRARRGR